MENAETAKMAESRFNTRKDIAALPAASRESWKQAKNKPKIRRFCHGLQSRLPRLARHAGGQAL